MKFYKLSGRILTLALISTALVSCNKDSKNNSGQVDISNSTDLAKTQLKKNASTQTTASRAEFLKSLPKDTAAVLYFNNDTTGAKDLLKSPWARKSQTGILPEQKLEVGGIDWSPILKKSGIDSSLTSSLMKLANTGALFLRPTDASGKLRGAALVESDKSIQVENLLGSAIEEIKKSGNKISEIPNEQGKIYQLSPEIKLPPSPATAALEQAKKNNTENLFLSWNKQRSFISNNQELNQSFLANSNSALPDIFSDPNFKKATAGFSEEDRSLVLGYADLTKVLPPEALSSIPLKQVAYQRQMNANLETLVRALYDQDSVLDGMNGSPGAPVLSPVVGKPLFFLALDGSVLKSLKKAIAAKNPAQASQLAAVDQIVRIGFVTKVAPPGQFMFPVPALNLIIETSSPDSAKQISKQLELTGQALAGSQMSGMAGSPAGANWQSKKIAEQDVKFLMSPLGIGAFLSSKGKYIFLAMSEAGMKDLLSTASQKTKSFAENLSKKGRAKLADEPGLASYYLDFTELGKLLESMGGLLQMYAPNNKQALEFIKPENIERIKKCGKMVGAVTKTPGELLLNLHYEK